MTRINACGTFLSKSKASGARACWVLSGWMTTNRKTYEVMCGSMSMFFSHIEGKTSSFMHRRQSKEYSKRGR